MEWLANNIWELLAAIAGIAGTIYAFIAKIGKLEERMTQLEKELPRLESNINEKLSEIRAQLTIVATDIKALIGRK